MTDTAPDDAPAGGETESFSPVLPDDVEHLAKRVLEKASERRVSLATAESCTGGMIASVLTDVPARRHSSFTSRITRADVLTSGVTSG